MQQNKETAKILMGLAVLFIAALGKSSKKKDHPQLAINPLPDDPDKLRKLRNEAVESEFYEMAAKCRDKLLLLGYNY